MESLVAELEALQPSDEAQVEYIGGEPYASPRAILQIVAKLYEKGQWSDEMQDSQMGQRILQQARRFGYL